MGLVLKNEEGDHITRVGWVFFSIEEGLEICEGNRVFFCFVSGSKAVSSVRHFSLARRVPAPPSIFERCGMIDGGHAVISFNRSD